MSGTPTDAAAAPEMASAGFVRKSSGLVRAFSPTDTLMYNLLAMNPVLMSGLTLTLIVVVFPQANPWLTMLIAGVLCMPLAYVYSLLVSAIPRSGGDYTFQSRIWGGATATVFGFAGIIGAEILAILIVGLTVAQIVLSPGLTLLGVYYEAGWLASVGEWFGTTTGVLITTVVCAVWSSVVNLWGLRRYAQLQRWSLIAGLAGLALVFIIMLVQSHADFISNFNGFMSSHYGVDNAYQQVVASGEGSSGFTLSGTLVAMPLAVFSFIFPAWAAQNAGELKRAGNVKSNIYSILGAQGLAIFIATVAAALVVSRIGYDFFSSAGGLFFAESPDNPLPVPPYFAFFAVLIASSPAMAILVFATSLAWTVMWFPNITVACTRVALAMSFDGVLPAQIGKVDRRTHAPVVAIISVLVGFLLMCVLYLVYKEIVAYTSAFILLSLLTFTVTVIGGAVLPYRRKQLFESSPKGVQHRIAGIPTITLVAIPFVVFSGWLTYRCLVDDELGANTTESLVAMAALYAAGLAIYLVAAYVRRRRSGLSLNDAMRELPVE
jgi:basic amino acid/polyamine antiporter, APA family